MERLGELGRSLHVAQAGGTRAVQCRCPQPALPPACPVPTVGSALSTALQPTWLSCTPPQARCQPMGIAAPPVPITQNTLGVLLRVCCQHSPRLYRQHAAYTHRTEQAAAAAPHSQHNHAATALH